MNDKKFHEDYSRTHQEKKSTERGLGIVFAVACAVIGGLKLWNGKGGMAWLIAAGVFLFFTFFFLRVIRILYKKRK